MATISSQTLNYDTIRSLVQDTVQSDVVDNIFESSSFLSLMMADGRVSSSEGRTTKAQNGGLNILQPVRHTVGGAETFEKYDVLDTTPTDDITTSVLPFTKRYAAPITVSGSDLLGVSGDKAIKNYLADRTMVAQEALKDKISNDLYTGSTAIVGLDSAIAQGTYANIAGGTFSWWRSGLDTTAHTAANMEDSTSSSYLLKLLATGWNSCNHKNMPSNFILCEQAVFDIAERIGNSSGQFTTPTSARSKRMADLGFSVLEYRGIPLMVDNYINATSYPMYMGNTDFMKLYYHPDDNFKVGEFVKPSNQDSRIAFVTALLQLGISSRRHFYRWSDLNN